MSDPRIQGYARALDGCLFRLQATTQLAHLDALLAIDDVQGFVWCCEDTPRAHLEALRRIQSAGRRLVIPVEETGVEEVMNSLAHAGLMLRSTVDTVQKGEELLSRIAALT